ncbi:MAG TPA: glycosyltransferase family 39 protein [Streptosporangiaceae bacterium]
MSSTSLPDASAPPDGGADAAAPGRPGGWAAVAARSWPVAGAVAGMAAFGLWGLERDSSMGNDEVATRWAARLPLHGLAHLLSHVDAVHGLYYLLMHGWMAIGTSPAAMRIPSVISMTAGAAMIAVIGRRLTGSGWAGLFGGLVMALTPTITYYAQTARSYALVVACVLGATLVLLHALAAEVAGRRASRWWLGYGALVTLGGYLNELSLLMLAAHAVTVLMARYGRKTVGHWLAASAAGAVLVVPLLAISARQSAAVGWIPRPGLWSLRILFHDYFGATTTAAVLLLVCAVVAVLPPIRGWRRAGEGPAEAETEVAWWRRDGVSLPSVAAPLLVVPGAVLLLESLVARPLYVDRYVLYGEAGAALLAGAGVWRIGRWLADVAGRPRSAADSQAAAAGARSGAAGRSALLWTPGVIVCACALLLQLAPQQRVRTPQSRLFDFGGPSRYLATRADQGDGVLFLSSFYRKARLGYPADFGKVTDFAMAVSPTAAGTFQGVDKPVAAIRALMGQQNRIWVFGRSPFAPTLAGPSQAEAIALRQQFTLVSEHRFRGIFVTLWLPR